jgi:hypothetical protein
MTTEQSVCIYDAWTSNVPDVDPLVWTRFMVDGNVSDRARVLCSHCLVEVYVRWKRTSLIEASQKSTANIGWYVRL